MNRRLLVLGKVRAILLFFIIGSSCLRDNTCISNAFDYNTYNRSNKYKLTINYTPKNIDENEESIILRAYIDENNCTHFNKQIEENSRVDYIKAFVLTNVDKNNRNLIFQITVNENSKDRIAYKELELFLNDYKLAYARVHKIVAKELFNTSFDDLNSEKKKQIMSLYPYNPSADHYIYFLKNKEEVEKILNPL